MLNNQMVYVVTFEADMVVPVLEAPIYNMNSFSVLSAPFNTFNVYVIYIYTYTDWWFQTFGLFSISYMGMSSSQLANSFFQRGRYTTNPLII